MNRPSSSFAFALTVALSVASAALGLGACASQPSYIYGTKVPDSEQNRSLIATCEQYRVAVEKKDVRALMSLASKNYWEDGGTPTGSDDYGYDGLQSVLDGRFARADGIRYTMKYMNVKRLAHNRAAVDVMIDATYSIASARGPQRLDMRDQNELVLEWDGRRWLIVSGM
jgi:hypothetical protein